MRELGDDSLLPWFTSSIPHLHQVRGRRGRGRKWPKQVKHSWNGGTGRRIQVLFLLDEEWRIKRTDNFSIMTVSIIGHIGTDTVLVCTMGNYSQQLMELHVICLLITIFSYLKGGLGTDEWGHTYLLKL